jgi:hypothetical protein
MECAAPEEYINAIHEQGETNKNNTSCRIKIAMSIVFFSLSLDRAWGDHSHE